MAKEYRTKSGDTWDLIAYEQMGDCGYMDILMDANRAHVRTAIFSAGTDHPVRTKGWPREEPAAMEEVRQ